ncbi:MAG: T9SS type A sorting domain-containing protein [Chitinophagaceae bacterium]|nr:T9SS type A sorting domain-containing protein [Chitinophagaceae bacterium]
MKSAIYFLILALATASFATADAQSCNGNLLTGNSGYYGGFEAATTNFSSTNAGTDYNYGMPPNGTYEIVNYASNAAGGGYLLLPPHSGNYQMLSHTRSVNNDRIWFKTVTVIPGSTYQFCAWIANAKTDPVNGFKINLLINGTIVAGRTAVYGWSQVCGTYTVPAGISSVTLSIGDPDSHTGPSHFLGLDDICFTSIGAPVSSLGNLVWNDANGNGKKDTNEPGIAGVTVSLYKDDNSDNLPDGAAIATNKTNSTGNYSFTGLPDGRYLVSLPVIAGYGASPAGNAVANPDNNINNDNNAINTRNNILYSNAITLQAGTGPTGDGDGSNGNLTLDLALCGNSILGDFVWNDLNGNGIQESGEPGIAGATVSLTYADGTVASVNTNADGYYYFKNLGPGVYEISFTTPTGFFASPVNMGNDDGFDSDPINGKAPATVLTDKSNLTVDAGFTDQSTLVSLGNQVWNDVNGNGLKDVGETGIEGVTVKLYKDVDGNNLVDGAFIATVVTNARGLYGFTGLAAGKYIVGITMPAGYSVTTTNFTNADNDIDNDNNGVNLVSNELRTNFITLVSNTEPVNDGDGNNGNMTLDFGICGTANLGDFIWNDLNGNGLQDIGEPGLGGVKVTLTYADGAIISVTSDANGLYKFVNLGPGIYTLNFVTPAGFNATTSNTGTNDAKDSDPVNGEVGVNIVAGTNNYTVDAGFYAGNLKLGNLVWNDTDKDGLKDTNEPGIAGVQVRLYKDDNSDNLPDGSAIATAVTNLQGSYLFSGLANGRYLTGVTIPNGYVEGGLQPGSANPDNNVDNDNNGINKTGSEIYTNAITLTAGLEPATDGDDTNGNLTLDIALSGNAYIGNLVWNDVNANGIQDVNEPGIANVIVSLTYADGTVKSVTSDANGEYYFSNIAPGTYTLNFITPPNFIPVVSNFGTNDALDSDPVNGSVTVTIEANTSNTNVDAGFKQVVSLSLGNLVWNDLNDNGLKDLNESGIGGLTVNLYADVNGDNIADGQAIKTTATNATGIYTFTNLSQGKFIVGVVLPAGYSIGFTTPGGAIPDNNLNNDNNGIVSIGSESRSNAITLSKGAEPTNDEDDSNGNLTLDFGLKTVDKGCTGNLITAPAGYYGGFEAGANNISSTTAGSDLYNRLPRNGSYQIVNNVSEPGGGGYLNIQPHSGNYFLATHTSNRVGDRIWYTTVSVTPGATYNFCTYVTLLKNLGSGADFIIGLYVNGTSIATGRVSFDWTSICGSYTVPAGVTSIELSVRDPKKGLFFAALDDMCFTLAATPSGVIGQVVFYDINNNGIQDAGEGGIANVTVSLTEGSVTRTTNTNAAGYYQFTNVSNGLKTINFTTPAGFVASPSNQGTNDALDSDPVNGSVTFNLGINEFNNTIDAGFALKKCLSLAGSVCGAGTISKKTGLIINGNFSASVIAPSAGNTYTATANTTPATAYLLIGGQFSSQADYRGTGYSNQASGTENSFSLVNTAGSVYNGLYAGQETVSQMPFPGDVVKGVNAENSFLFWNGNQFATQGSLVWQQSVTGLMIGKTYNFRFYASNLMQPVNGTDDYNDPLIAIKFNGTNGLTDGTKLFPSSTYLTPDYYQLTKSETANATALNGWKRFEVTFVADAPTKTFKIVDYARGNKGDVLGITAIALEVCEKDTDGDCIADVDDIDDDNDGITDLAESGGFDPLGDFDSDGIANYKDQTPGYDGLSWRDCNNDNINDLFDFDADGIINELDLDSDNDGVLDVFETRDDNATDNNNDGMVDGLDNDGDGLLSTADMDDNVFGGPGLTPQDLDRDGKPNYLDLDSDGDGIGDLNEALETIDTDGVTNGADTDLDGVKGDYSTSVKNADTFNGFGAKGITPLDNDGDGYPDLYDVDSDDDGITDNVEAQPTCTYVEITGQDDDNDGLDNAYDFYNSACMPKGAGITPYDKDGDGTPDMYDLDTDNDGSPDINEGSGIYGEFVSNMADTDGDGILDQFDIFNIKTVTASFANNVVHSNMGAGGSNDGPLPAGSNAKLPQAASGNCSTGADRDWRNISILPVILTNFTGKSNLGKTELSWKVASEHNISNYTVERSINGQSFAEIGKVYAKGNSALTTLYNYTDDVAGLLAPAVYYRLKMVETAGTYMYSNVLTFKISNKGTLSFGFYPNPANSYLQVKVNAQKDGMVALRIIDGIGKIVYTSNSRISTGSNIISINNLSTLPSGMYTVQLITEPQTLNQKLVIAR